MTTLAVDSPQILVTGDMNAVPIIKEDIVFEGAMVGREATTGYGRPLVAGDKFLGHSIFQVVNTLGLVGGEKSIRLRTGVYRLVCALVGLKTDVGQPVYASDDATLTFDASGNSYVGRISRYESATKMEIEFVTCGYDEFGPNPNRMTKDDNYTIQAVDNGKLIYVTVDAKIITLFAGSGKPGYKITVVNGAGFNVAGIVVTCNASDKFLGGCDQAAGSNGGSITNTKATAQRGDFIQLVNDGVATNAGWNIVGLRGTWVQS